MCTRSVFSISSFYLTAKDIGSSTFDLPEGNTLWQIRSLSVMLNYIMQSTQQQKEIHSSDSLGSNTPDMPIDGPSSQITATTKLESNPCQPQSCHADLFPLKPTFYSAFQSLQTSLRIQISDSDATVLCSVSKLWYQAWCIFLCFSILHSRRVDNIPSSHSRLCKVRFLYQKSRIMYNKIKGFVQLVL